MLDPINGKVGREKIIIMWYDQHRSFIILRAISGYFGLSEDFSDYFGLSLAILAIYDYPGYLRLSRAISYYLNLSCVITSWQWLQCKIFAKYSKEEFSDWKSLYLVQKLQVVLSVTMFICPYIWTNMSIFDFSNPWAAYAAKKKPFNT